MKKIIFIILIVIAKDTYSQIFKPFDNYLFKKLINQGDSCLLAQNYRCANNCYSNADSELQLCGINIPKDSIPIETETIRLLVDKIKLTQSLIWLDQLKLNGSIDSQYKEYIKIADIHFNVNSYERALDAYIKANQLMPNEKYPIDKIIAIEQTLNQKKYIDIKYQEIKCNTKFLIQLEKYTEAITYIREQKDKYKGVYEIEAFEKSTHEQCLYLISLKNKK